MSVPWTKPVTHTFLLGVMVICSSPPSYWNLLWFQSHDKFRLPYMVCDFVIYISYGCSSHANDLHFTFSKIHRLNLALFVHKGGNRSEYWTTEWSGRRGRGREKEERLYHSSLTLRYLPDGRKYPAKRKLAVSVNEFYSIAANFVSNLTNA